MSRHDDVNKRMAHSNPQEDHFIYYLNWRKISYHHIGFQNRYTEDEWKKLNPALKKIPDFMAWIDGIPKFYEVKGVNETFMLKTYAHKMCGKWQKMHPVIYALYDFRFKDIILKDWKVIDKFSKGFKEEFVKDVDAKILPMDEIREL